MLGDCEGATPDWMDRQMDQQIRQCAVEIFVSESQIWLGVPTASGGVDAKNESKASTGERETVPETSFRTRK